MIGFALIVALLTWGALIYYVATDPPWKWGRK